MTKLEQIDHLREQAALLMQSLMVLSNARSPEVRLRAIESLGSLSSCEIVNRLRIGLADTDELVKVACIEILDSRWDRRIEADLCSCLRDKRWLVRGTAAVALGNIGAVNKISTIEARLAVAEEEERVRLTYALTKLGRSDYLCDFLSGLHSQFYRVRCAAANLISGIATARNRQILADLVECVLSKEQSKAAKSSLEGALKRLRTCEVRT